MTSLDIGCIPDLLPIYYKRLFPYESFYRWLSYGSQDRSTFSHRELSFTLAGDVYIRFLSFDDLEEFRAFVQKKKPEKIDIGAVYNMKPKLRKMTSEFEVVEKELVFDIDMTDYDSVRTCCSKTDVCLKCWKLMVIATKVIDVALRDDFGFKNILWVFSGRRGVHCWVCDDIVRTLPPRVRADIAEYLQLLTVEDHTGKVAHVYPEKMHPSIRRALEIIKKDFVETCVIDQDMLGTKSGMAKVLKMMEEPLRHEIEPHWEHLDTSQERWDALVKTFDKLFSKGSIKKKNRYFIEELMLQYSYPRLDIEVSRGSNHLLKAPFCIHPKTGKLCVPFNPNAVSKFNPETVPTIFKLVNEIQEFDEKEKVVQNNDSEAIKRNVKDHKKTSMFKCVQVFEEFLRKLEENWKKNKTLDVSMEF